MPSFMLTNTVLLCNYSSDMACDKNDKIPPVPNNRATKVLDLADIDSYIKEVLTGVYSKIHVKIILQPVTRMYFQIAILIHLCY